MFPSGLQLLCAYPGNVLSGRFLISDTGLSLVTTVSSSQITSLRCHSKTGFTSQILNGKIPHKQLSSESLQARPPLSAFSVFFQASTEHVPLKPSWSGPPQKHCPSFSVLLFWRTQQKPLERFTTLPTHNPSLRGASSGAKPETMREHCCWACSWAYVRISYGSGPSV